MADVKISALPAASALDSTEVAPVVQSSVTKKATVQQFTTAITGATGTNGETVTASTPRFDLAQTWNNVAVTFTGTRLNITDTASNAGSFFASYQLSGISRYEFAKTSLRLYNVNDATTTNYERAKFAWESNSLRIGTEKAGTGTARSLELQTDGTTRMTFSADNSLASIASSNLVVGSQIRMASGSRITDRSNGVISISTSGENDFLRLQFGSTSSSFPAIKRNTTSLQARLADDSAFTNIQGKLTTETNYTAGAIVPTGFLVLYDAAGTAYKIPAVAV